MQILNQLREWLNVFSSVCGATSVRRRRSAVLRQQSGQPQIQQLESRLLLAATNPLTFDSIDGTNGFRLEGSGWSGISVSDAGDVNGDGYDDVVVGAWYFDNRSGASHVVFGKADGFDAAIDLSTLDGTDGFRIDGVDSFDYTGKSVSTAGDVNGDGYDDLIIGAYGAADTINNIDWSFSGEAYVMFGKASGFSATFDPNSLDGNNGFKLDGLNRTDHFGEAVSTAGDVNGDGYDDLIVGAPFATSSNGAGDSYVVFGKAAGFSAVIQMSALNGNNGFRLDGIDTVDFSGSSVSTAGDFNGDGLDDLIIGAPNAASNPIGVSNSTGESYLVFGKPGGFAAAFDLASLDGNNGFRLDGVDRGDSSGTAVSSAGDINGDGFDDIIIGTRVGEPGADTGTSEGESYLVFGQAGGFAAIFDLATLDGVNGFQLNGVDAGDWAGVSVGGAGDVNGDGFDDLILEAPGAGAPGTGDFGERYIVFGKADAFPAEFDLSLVNGTNGFRIAGRGSDSTYPTTFVSGAGDVNGDGFDDVIIGAPDTFGGEASYVIFGGNFTGGAETQPGGDGNNTLTANQGPNAIDILVGGRGNDTLISDGGADVIRGGQGDDTLVIQDAVFNTTRRLLGGNGTDTLQVTGTGVHLDLTAIADNRIVDVEVIDIVDTGNTLTLDLQEVLNISSHSNTLTVFRAGTDTVNRGTGWTQQSNEVVDGRTFEVFTQGAATLRIHTVPTIAVAVTPADVIEDAAGLLTYTFTRDVTFGPLTVDFAVGGSATLTTDYTTSGATLFTAAIGSVSFPDGQSTAVITISPVADNVVELEETVGLTLSASSERRYLTGSPDTASGTITDDDTATFTINDVTANEGAGTVSFTVATSNPLDTAVVVQVAFADTTATGNNTDYNSATRIITFSAGDSSSRTVSIPITNDILVELTETFAATLSTATALGTRSTDFSDGGVGSITDNDTATFTIDDVTVNEDAGTATFTVSVDNPLDVAVEVDVLYADGTAVGVSGGGGAHFDNDTDRVTFAAGSTTDRQVNVAITDDNIITGDRDFSAALSLVTDVGTRNTNLTDMAVGIIIDDTARFTISNVTVNEDVGVATFTVSLDNALDIPVDVTVSYSNGTATGSTGGTSSDFDNLEDVVTFSASDTSDKSVTVQITDDNIVEGTHDFTAMLATITSLGARTVDVADTGTGIIQDNDSAGFAVSESDDSSVTTEAGANDDFTVVLKAQPETDVVIAMTSGDVTEAIVAPALLTFTPANWDSPQAVTLTGVDDSTVDGDQETSVAVSVVAADSADAFDGLPDQVVSVLTADDDVAGFLISRTEMLVSETGATDTFTVVLERAPLSNVVLNVLSSDTGEATVDTASLTFTRVNWNSAQTVIVRGVDDNVADGDQTSTVTLSVDIAASDDAFDSLPGQTMSVTTSDDDPPALTLNIMDASISENGGTTAATVSRNTNTTNALTVILRSSDTTEATVPATVTIPADQATSTAFSITAVDDIIDDNTQTVSITAVAADHGDGTDTLEVTDDETTPFVVTAPVGIVESIRPTISWTAVDGALSYDVWLNIDNGGGNVFRQLGVSSSQTSLTIQQDLEFARYRVFVYANMSVGAQETAAGHTFVLNVKSQLTPIGAATTTTPQFTWSRVPGASAYRIFVNVPGSPATAVIADPGSGSTATHTLTNALARNDYKWWIRPVRESGWLGPWSDASKFSTGGRTGVTAPAPDSTVTESIPEFRWPAVPDAQSYEVYVSKVGTPGVLYRDPGVTETSLRSRVLDDGDYKVWIRTTMSDGSGVWGGGVSFTVVTTTTGLQTTPLTPSAAGFDTTPEFLWQETTGATSYDVYLHNGTSSLLKTVLTGTSYTPITALADGEWTWSIRPVNASGVGTWSAETEFTTNGLTKLLTPGTLTTDTTPTFSWQPVTGVVAYSIQVDNQTTSTANVIREDGLVTTSFTPTTSLTSGTYRAWVRAISSTANGPWSTQFDFVVAFRKAVDSTEPSQNLLASVLVLEDTFVLTVQQPFAVSPGPAIDHRTQPFDESTAHDSQCQETVDQMKDLDEQFEVAQDWLSNV